MDSAAPPSGQLPPSEPALPDQVYLFPASFAQRAMWFLDQLDPGAATYVVAAPFRVLGPLDETVLKRTLDDLVRRHEALRTSFAVVDHEPVQVVAESQEFPFEVKDLRDLPEAGREAAAARFARLQATLPFDLSTGPLVRATLMRLAEDQHVLVIAMHHIICDGWSLDILIREASALYAAHRDGKPSLLPELEIQYGDYSAWQRQGIEEGRLATQIEYWKRQLADAPAALDLPTSRPRGERSGERGGHLRLRLDGDLVEGLRRRVRDEGATLYMGLLTAYVALLNRYSNQDDICVGTPVAGRIQRQIEDVVGPFVNTLVLRADVSGFPSFRALLRRVKEVTLAAFAHQEVPFEKLVEVLSPERRAGRTPLFQTLFNFQAGSASAAALGDARLVSMAFDGETAKFDLTVSLKEEPGGAIEGYFEYDAGLLDAERIARMSEHYRRLLEAFASDPDRPVASAPMLSDAERRQALAAADPDDLTGPEPLLIHQLFEYHAARIPDACAVVGGGRRLSYRALEVWANRLARRLRSGGAGPENRIAILIEPSVEMAVAVLGVLKAGAAYVPIDPEFPEERIRYVLDHAEIRTAVTVSAVTGRLSLSGLDVVVLDADDDPLAALEGSGVPNIAVPGNAAYAIYTSGSTGRPKGVVVEHRQVTGYLRAIVRRLGLETGARYAMVQSLAVDACNTVLLPALCHGGTLHLLPRSRATDPEAFCDDVGEQGCEILKIAPSHLAALLDASPADALLPGKALVLGGEASRWRWMREKVLPRLRPGARAFIHYGPTETTVGVLVHRVDPDSMPTGALVPLGTSLGNARCYLLSGALEPVPSGVVGEIFIAGDCVARGYLTAPALTADRFIPDPYGKSPGGRMYRSGDLARRLADGTLEFIGRRDHQLKINGFRVELGEIESTLLSHPAVGAAVVVARDAETDGKQLFGYVTGAAGSGDPVALARELRQFLSDRLPRYMVPRAIVVMDALPVNAQRKLDVSALPISTPAIADGGVDARPKTPAEAEIASIWQDLLGGDGIGVNDDFFRLGGHSLMATRMLAIVRRRFGRSVSVAGFLRNPTVEHLARLLVGTDGMPAPGMPGLEMIDLGMVDRGRGGEEAPLFLAHPIGGNAACYAQLARVIGRRRSVHAFQSFGSRSWTTLEELAARHLHELRRVAPRGPYRLGGWSFGGLLAFEMVRQLESEGCEVAFVAILDTYPPQDDAERGRGRLSPLARFAADVAATIGLSPADHAHRFLDLPEDRQREQLADIMRKAGLISGDSGAEFDELVATYERHAHAADGYRCGRIRADIELILAGDGDPDGLAAWWSDRTSGRINRTVIAGDHHSLLRPPLMQAVAAVIENRLAGAEPARRSHP